MVTPSQQAYDIQRARERAKTQGHADRRAIDADYRSQAAKAKAKAKARGARKGFWEGRPNDEGTGWMSTQRDAAEGQASWTKVHPGQAARQPNNVGFLTGKVFGAIQDRLDRPKTSSGLQAQGQPLPPPVMPPGLPPRGPAGGGSPAAAGGLPPPQQPMNHHWLNVKGSSGLPAGGGQPAPTAGALGTGQLGLPWGGRQPGQKRVLTGQRPMKALGTGSPALGTGGPVIDAESRSVPNDYAKAKAAVEGGGSYMDAMYGGGKTAEDVANDDWVDTARQRIAFTTDPKNKIPVPDPRISGTGRYQDQVDKHNAAYSKAAAKTGFAIPSLYANDD